MTLGSVTQEAVPLYSLVWIGTGCTVQHSSLDFPLFIIIIHVSDYFIDRFSNNDHSFSFIPRVVTAGVPMRMAACDERSSVSKGIVFLFRMILAS